MAKSDTKKIVKGAKPTRFYLNIVESFTQERTFLAIILVEFLMVAAFYQDRQMAMWIGFVLAAYSAVVNDSIRLLGTFIESNKKQKWWMLWLLTGVIFVVIMLVGWLLFNGMLRTSAC